MTQRRQAAERFCSKGVPWRRGVRLRASGRACGHAGLAQVSSMKSGGADRVGFDGASTVAACAQRLADLVRRRRGFFEAETLDPDEVRRRGASALSRRWAGRLAATGASGRWPRPRASGPTGLKPFDRTGAPVVPSCATEAKRTLRDGIQAGRWRAGRSVERQALRIARRKKNGSPGGPPFLLVGTGRTYSLKFTPAYRNRPIGS